MERPLKEITLPQSKVKVKLLPWITYGENTELQNAMLEGASPEYSVGGGIKLNAKGSIAYLKKMVVLIAKKYVDKDGSEKDVTEDWLNELHVEDGKALESSCSELVGDQKKTPKL